MSTRRAFLRSLGTVTTLATLTPERILAEPARPFLLARRPASPVRVRGRVRGDGRGIAGVPVTDGRDVVVTDRSGRFELVTHADRSHVQISLPSGWTVPRSDVGTAACHRALMPDRRGEAQVEFQLTRSLRSDADHTALFLPDIQTENAREMARFHDETVPDLEDTIRAAGDGEVFGIACGDIMFDDLTLYPEYERAVARLGVPFFQCVGNHDLDFDGGSDEASTVTFGRHFGPRYYSFDRGEVHYVVLDDVLWHGAGYIGYLGYEQLRWLEADLALREPGTPVIVATHIPVEGTRHTREGQERPGVSTSVQNREVLHRLLEPFAAHIVAGHTHENDHRHGHGLHEHVSGTVCGAWWSGDICADGTPNGYSVYEVRGSQVRWRYKATGQAADHQMRLYPRGSDPTAPTELVANVWDADEGWTVVWYEDGVARGSMARRVGRDPRSVAEHAGPERPAHRPWVDPYPAGHLYYAPVDAQHGTITVEARDRFGRTWTGRLP